MAHVQAGVFDPLPDLAIAEQEDLGQELESAEFCDTRDGEATGVAPWPPEHLVVGHRIVGEAEDLGLKHREVDQLRGAPHP